MSTVQRTLWHPLTGAATIAVVAAAAALVALAAWQSVAPATAAGLTAFLAAGAVAGFAVSGST